MPYVYLLHPPHFKDDVYKIGGSEHMDNCSLKSYGKGTEILAMIVINGNYLAVEKQIKNSFNSKFTLVHGKEHFQGDRNEMKLEFLKIIYNYELLMNDTEEQYKKPEYNKDNENQFKCKYCYKTFATRYRLKKHTETTLKCIQNRRIKVDTVIENKDNTSLNETELNSILNRFMDEKIDRITKEEYELVSPLEKHKKRIKISIMFGIFIDYINKIGVKSNVTKSVFYDYIEKYNLELVTIDEYSYYLCKQKYNVVHHQLEPEVEVESDVNPEAKVEVDPEAQVESDIEPEPKVEAESDIEPKVEVELDDIEVEVDDIEVDLEDEVSSFETKLNKQVTKTDDIIYHRSNNCFGKMVYSYSYIFSNERPFCYEDDKTVYVYNCSKCNHNQGYFV
jgi:hypothetical protein